MSETKGRTKQTLNNLLWMGSGQGVYYLINLLITVVLARLLTPIEFGMVAAAMLVIKFAETFSMMGIGPALIQRQEITVQHIRTGFTLSLLLGGLFSTAVWFLAPFLSTFFQVDRFVPILRTLVFLFPIHSLGVVAESLLTRQLKFKYLAMINLVSSSLGYGAITIILALADFSAWAIVYGTLTAALLKTAVLLRLEKHPKKLLWDKEAAKELITFGGGVTITSISGYFAKQGDNLLISWGLGPTALGIYSRAYNLVSLPVNLVGKILDQVLFPSMAAIQQDEQRLKKMYMLGLTATALLTVPVSTILFILAPEIVWVLLGPAWAEMTGPFQYLTLIIYFRTAYKISDSLVRASGAIYRQAWLQTFYAICVIVASFIGLRWGPIGVSVGVVLAVTIHYLLMLRLSRQLTKIGMSELLDSLRPLLLLLLCFTLPMFLLVTQLRFYIPEAWLLIVVSLFGTSLFFMLLFRANPKLILGKHGILLSRIIFSAYGRKNLSLQKILSRLFGKKFLEIIYA